MRFIHDIKRIAAGLMMSALLFACTDDIEVIPSETLRENQIMLNFSVEDPEIVSTRDASAEQLLSADCNHYALIFSVGSDNRPDKLLQREEISGIATASSVVLTLSKEIASDLSKIRIIGVANVSKTADPVASLTIGTSTYSDLLECLTPALSVNTVPASPFVMSGVGESAGTGNTINIPLQKTVSKLSVTSSARYFELIGYSMYNAPSQGFITAATAFEDDGLQNKDNYVYKTGTSILVAGKDGDLLQNYTYPVKSLGSNMEGEGAYFIVEGKFKGQPCFYRVDLAKETSGYHDLEPNHWYEVVITEVLRMGYPTAYEAAKRSMAQEDTSLLEVAIHDHAAKVLSMVTDGTRELGVTKILSMNPENKTAYLTVKCYSQITSENADGMNKPKVTKKGNVSWLTVGEGEKIAENELELSGEVAGDNPGTQWKYALTASDAIYSEDKATLVVEWMGLRREVEVKFDAVFNISSICSAFLTNIGGINGIDHIDNYWDFIGNKVVGISPDDMAGGKVRNEGFHFPMPYGNDLSSPAEYEYELNFKNVPNGKRVINVQAEVSNDTDPYLKNILWEFNEKSIDGSLGASGTLKLSSSADMGSYEYATGKVIFTVQYDNDPAFYPPTYYPVLDDFVFSVPMYHTGFFHPVGIYTYYYEVVPIGKYHWLDRNLGATSNKMYADYADGSHVGTPEAKGWYFSIAEPGSNYGDPTIKDGSSKYTICPPGYHIPNTTEWDDLRLSPNFLSERVSEGNRSYVSTYYASGDANVGNVYFPKARFFYDKNMYNSRVSYDGQADSGDDAAGYYWTRNPSYGLEKVEIGQWLQVLYLSGNSSSYINGKIKYDKMSLRCVAGAKPAEETAYSINFNVKGATHVYLYTYDKETGTKSGIFTFPGKAIGSQKAVDALSYGDNDTTKDDSYLHFSYNSSVPPDKLFVFFTYVTDAGKITILSKEGSTLGDAVGWPVQVGYNYYFTDKGVNRLDSRGIFKTQ